MGKMLPVTEIHGKMLNENINIALESSSFRLIYKEEFENVLNFSNNQNIESKLLVFS
jgi:hypothetical protein